MTLNRPISFISLSHGDNQSELTTKFYNFSKADVGGGGGGGRAGSDFVRTGLNHFGLSKISGSFTPFTEKEAPAQKK